MSAAESLERGITALGLDLPAGARERLLAYLRLLAKWNRVHNLSAIRDQDEAVTLHLLDSLAVAPHLACARLADVGSGGGLPGIPLAIALPHMEVALVEAGGKKASFLQQAKIELALANVAVHHGRVESWRPAQPFDGVISRAFASLAEFVTLARHLLAPGGRFLAMKGVYPAEELRALPEGFALDAAIALRVPGLDAERHLIVIKKS